jgi:flagellar biosynthesis/type III secretory pathway M-ring protein FliF/YscJ
MKFLSFIIFFYLLFNVCPLLTKYGEEEISTNDVIFESKDFKDDEEMHFKIKTDKNRFISNSNNKDVKYFYFNDANADTSSVSLYHHTYFKKTENNEFDFVTKYFTIKKTRNEYRPSNGNYLYITFPKLTLETGHSATITNTKEDEGKLETWVIIVIVVVVVLIIAGIVIFFVCRCIRNRKAMLAANANAANYAAQSQAAANYAAQNAAYAAQNAQNAYIAEQNYQAQVRAQAHQAQIYQDRNYVSPSGAPPDTIYTSKPIM